MNTDILQKAANESRGLAIDAVHAAKSGHLGLPLGAAEIGAVLFGEKLRINPDEPRWINRDRFILSAGHGSMFLFSWLHLSGYDLSLHEIKSFRQLGSKTPGHPEFGTTPGVECTTGPLGQGIGNAVGMAISQKMAETRINTTDGTLLDYHIFCLAGDGCIQEGISAEACSLAGHLGLDNLILIFDSNDVTLDAMAAASQSEDTGARFSAYGFDVKTIDGHDMGAISKAIDEAKENNNGKPKLIIAKTLIGKGIEEVAGTSKAHGEGGANYRDSALAALGLPLSGFYVSAEVRKYFETRKGVHLENYRNWKKDFDSWKQNNPEKAEILEPVKTALPFSKIIEKIPVFPDDTQVATRKAGSSVLQHLAEIIPNLISGSADLHGSTLNYIESSSDFTRDDRSGRNFRFGIREHAMGAIINGIAYDGLFRASGATFETFSDYMRPSIRIAALSHLPVFYIFTHDSVGVGEDGPTHQPIEITSALRCIPNLDVIRPSDPEETAGAFAAAVDRADGPTALILTRQAVENISEIPVKDRRLGVFRGGYIAHKETGKLKLILISSGSELQHAMGVASQIGDGVRVVSLPCFERFDRQTVSYREEVLPSSCRKRIAMEAGTGGLLYKYTGLDGKVISIERFGLSAPGGTAMKELGITAGHLLEAVKEML